MTAQESAERSIDRVALTAARGALVPRKANNLQRLLRRPLGVLGLVLVLIAVAVAVTGRWVAPHDPFKTRMAHQLLPPGSESFYLGTDQLGRDVLSRLIFGAATSVTIGVSAVAIGSTAGALIGVWSGFLRGKVDFLAQRLIDTLMAFPLLVLAIVIVAVLGQSTVNVVVALAIVLLPQGARVIRSTALSVCEQQYIEAARAIGCPSFRIAMVHVLPQCVAPYLIVATAGIGWAIIVEASLSFLGLGAPPPQPTWGGMLSGAARDYAQQAPWLVVFPGIAISLSVFGFNMLGDALRDVLDPRLRS